VFLFADLPEFGQICQTRTFGVIEVREKQAGCPSCQDSHKPGKPGIVTEFCKPGKVREFEIWSVKFL